MESEDKETAATAQRLISQPEVQRVLSEPLTYDLAVEVPKRNAILQRHGFTLLSSKSNSQNRPVPFYSVVEHSELPDFIIKSGATRIPEGSFMRGPLNDRNEMAIFTAEESLFRIEMANRIQRVAQEAGIDVVLPRKKLVAYANSEGITEPNKKYCVVCEKINILSVQDTVQAIKSMNQQKQKEIARKISTIVERAGLVDASFDNIRFTPDGKLAFIDTEPAGLMAAKKPGVWNKLFGPKGASVEKCARIGLFTLMHQTSKAVRGTQSGMFDGMVCESGLEHFRDEVEAQL